MLTGASSRSRPPQMTTSWKTSRSGRATPARATTAENASIDQASASTNGTSAREAGERPTCQAARARRTRPAAVRASAPQCGIVIVEAASFSSDAPVWSSAIGSRHTFGERTFARPEAASRTPKRPMNCQRDHGSTPPRAVAVRITPTRFRNESRKTRASPRNARPEPTWSRPSLCTSRLSRRTSPVRRPNREFQIATQVNTFTPSSRGHVSGSSPPPFRPKSAHGPACLS